MLKVMVSGIDQISVCILFFPFVPNGLRMWFTNSTYQTHLWPPLEEAILIVFSSYQLP